MFNTCGPVVLVAVNCKWFIVCRVWHVYRTSLACHLLYDKVGWVTEGCLLVTGLSKLPALSLKLTV